MAVQAARSKAETARDKLPAACLAVGGVGGGGTSAAATQSAFRFSFQTKSPQPIALQGSECLQTSREQHSILLEPAEAQH